jgi:Ulp1 family protease
VDIQGHDIAALRNGEWLNDEIINFHDNVAPRLVPVHHISTPDSSPPSSRVEIRV